MPLKNSIQRASEFKTVATTTELDFARRLAQGESIPDAYSACLLGKGLDRKECYRKGQRLARTRRIEERVAHFTDLINRRFDIREERILAELAAIAFSDPADFIGEDGMPVPIRSLPPHARAAVSQIDSGVRPGGQPFLRIRFHDKIKSLQTLVKVKNLEAEHQSSKAPTINIGIQTTPLKTIERVTKPDDDDKT